VTRFFVDPVQLEFAGLEALRTDVGAVPLDVAGTVGSAAGADAKEDAAAWVASHDSMQVAGAGRLRWT